MDKKLFIMLDSSDTENDELSEIEQKIEKENWDIKPEDEKKILDGAYYQRIHISTRNMPYMFKRKT